MSKTIKVSDHVAEKIKEINQIRGDKSLSKTIESFLPQGTKTDEGYLQEPPAFTLSNILISWTELKNAEIGKSWKVSDESATVIFHDEYGSLVRFMIGTDVWVEYFHFI